MFPNSLHPTEVLMLMIVLGKVRHGPLTTAELEARVIDAVRRRASLADRDLEVVRRRMRAVMLAAVESGLLAVSGGGVSGDAAGAMKTVALGAGLTAADVDSMASLAAAYVESKRRHKENEGT